MFWQDEIPKKALKCIKNEIEFILFELELEENLKDKLKKELLDYVAGAVDRYCGKYPKVPTRYLAGALEEEADWINEWHILHLKKELEKLNRISTTYNEYAEETYPDLKEDLEAASNKLQYAIALASGLRQLSAALEVISGNL